MPSLTKRKVLIVAGVVTLFAVIGAIVGIVVWQTKDKSDGASTKSGGATDASASTSDKGSSVTKSGTSGSSNSSSDGSSKESSVTSDPTKEKFTLSAYAVGDWGTTTTRDSCCKRRADHTPTNVDKNAEDVVAAIMGKAADVADPKPKVVLGHGDNFYWVGIIDDKDQAYRFEETFENKFNSKSLLDIPWVNVMGNHDYGGASYICAAGGTWAECKDEAALEAGLKAKFSLQAEYKSPNSNRWIMSDHFYVHSIEDEDSGVSIDIFNLDTNDADVHGAQQICCQCYSYADGDDKSCNSVARGDKYCFGGNTGMFDKCMKMLNDWGEDSRKQLVEKAKASKATWKIVNTHYSPYNHYAAGNIQKWWDTLDGLGIQLWINGHTHGEKHDYSNIKMHFIENGAGGGILNEAASGIPPYVEDKIEKIWNYGTHDYGFFELSASKEWLRARFLTNDDKWSVQDDFTQSTIGGVAAKHCWYIPVDGGKGQSCDTTTTTTEKHHKVHIRINSHHQH
ncbi:hypothetical protein Poli38472_007809 [Pythium oligandrum]|uniref:Calcineurin-like phosphoesterase domain-containing protein n=1 Tax=Pythium oligandrum TaxID=41045 RepID=A0A8K1CQV3_PYTOL|nr:hypothetical protein Poli38472_007809 [Pythium oligandrum]|eukprot:TMW68137.1 hypothetical protein Poli38472_007809 [Pythium oligandrum]